MHLICVTQLDLESTAATDDEPEPKEACLQKRCEVCQFSLASKFNLRRHNDTFHPPAGLALCAVRSLLFVFQAVFLTCANGLDARKGLRGLMLVVYVDTWTKCTTRAI